MTSGTSSDTFEVSENQEKAFQELLKNARQLRGWSQQEAERVSREQRLPLKQTLISSLERGPYPGMRLWDVYKLCRVYGLQISQVLDALGWSENALESAVDRRLAVICSAVRNLPSSDADMLLTMIERYIIGIRHQKD